MHKMLVVAVAVLGGCVDDPPTEERCVSAGCLVRANCHGSGPDAECEPAACIAQGQDCVEDSESSACWYICAGEGLAPGWDCCEIGGVQPFDCVSDVGTRPPRIRCVPI